ncbi:linker for activation of T-cells family member 1 isoform X2 [Stigmatopora argus]
MTSISIREASDCDDYIESARFWLVHRHQTTARMNPDLSLAPFVPALAGSSPPGRSSQRQLTETDSNHSYQNSHNEADLRDSFNRDYLIVLPQNEVLARRPSGASTTSSGQTHDYENVQGGSARPSQSDDREYLTVIGPPQSETSTLSSQSDEEDYSDVGVVGKYVNQAGVQQVQFNSEGFPSGR